MKKIILSLTAVLITSGTLLVSCNSATKEEKVAQEKVQIASDDLKQAVDSLTIVQKEAKVQEWKDFQKSGDSVLTKNEIRIAALRLKMKKTGSAMDANYQKKMDILEQKNQDLKAKMDSYKKDASADWQSFKREFKHDTDEIGQAFEDLTVNNKN